MWLALCALVVGLGAAPASAYLRAMAVDSVEWLTFDSDVIVRGVATKVVPAGTGQTRSAIVTLRVTEVLKGAPAETLTFFTATESANGWEIGEHLYFLVGSQRYLTQFGQTHLGTNAATALASVPLAMRWNWRNHPLLTSEGAPAPSQEYDGHGRQLTTARAMLDLIRREAANPPKQPKGVLELHVSPQSTFFPSEKAQYSPYLNLLVDERAEARAKEWIGSPQPLDRWNGVQVLSRFPSPENAALLRGMLADPFEADGHWPGGSDFIWHGGYGKWRVTLYPMRGSAYEALKAWQMAPREAVLTKPPYPVTYLRPWTPGAWAAGIAGVLVVLLLWGWIGRRRWTGGVTGVCLLLLLLTAGLWLYSRARIVELALTDKDGHRWETALLNGRLRVIKLEGWNSPAPATWIRTERNTTAEADWTPASQAWNLRGGTPTHAGRLGFAIGTGTVVAPAFSGYVFRAWTVPLWSACALFAVVPTGRLVHVLLRRRRAGANCCSACG
jgi:hypothetical protein